VPSANFGNMFAGIVAKRMGLPVDRFIIATNSNDILDRTLKTGRYDVTGVHPTISPSMDIQVSSNFERLVYLANRGSTSAVRAAMGSLTQSGSFTLTSPAIKSIRNEFDSGATSEDETSAMMAQALADLGELIDPHTAVGLHVALHHNLKSPLITLATAHPAKFPDAVHKATGQMPHLPSRLSHLMKAPESFTIVPNSVAAVKEFILSNDKR
jgi:threonine synthase